MFVLTKANVAERDFIIAKLLWWKWIICSTSDIHNNCEWKTCTLTAEKLTGKCTEWNLMDFNSMLFHLSKWILLLPPSIKVRKWIFICRDGRHNLVGYTKETMGGRRTARQQAIYEPENGNEWKKKSQHTKRFTMALDRPSYLMRQNEGRLAVAAICNMRWIKECFLRWVADVVMQSEAAVISWAILQSSPLKLYRRNHFHLTLAFCGFFFDYLLLFFLQFFSHVFDR